MGRFYWAIPIVVAASNAQAQLSLRTVAMTGDVCPGTTISGLITGFKDGTSEPQTKINSAGRVAFEATCSDASGSAILTEGHGALSRIRPGDPVSGHGPLNTVLGPRLADTGDMVFLGVLDGNSRLGFIKDAGGPLQALVLNLDNAPGSDGDWFDSFSSQSGLSAAPNFSSGGQPAFYATLSGGTRGVWSYQGGTLNLVALEGTPVPDHSGEIFGAVGDSGPITLPSINSHGDVGFSANGAWIKSAAGYRHVTRTQQDLPSNCVNLETPAINDADQAAYVAKCYGLSGAPEKIMSEAGGSLHTVANSTDAPPGMPAGSTFVSMSSPVITGSGDTVFHSRVLTGGQSRDAFFAEDVQGLLKVLVAEGMQVPGMSSGVLFDNLSIGTPSANVLGHVLFTASMNGPGVTARGIWLSDIATGGLSLLLASGQTLEVRPGDSRQISDLSYYTYVNGQTLQPVIGGSGGQDGAPTPLNENDQFAFKAYFTDGSSGIFVATIPEPATAAILSFLGLTLLGRRSRRP